MLKDIKTQYYQDNNPFDIEETLSKTFRFGQIKGYLKCLDDIYKYFQDLIYKFIYSHRFDIKYSPKLNYAQVFS